MAKRVIWSKIAIADRISILDYWRQRIGSPTYSIRLNNEIKHVVQLLSQFPSLGRHLENREERFFVVDNYLVIYFEAEDHIEILHVWDSRRNPEDLVL